MSETEKRKHQDNLMSEMITVLTTLSQSQGAQLQTLNDMQNSLNTASSLMHDIHVKLALAEKDSDQNTTTAKEIKDTIVEVEKALANAQRNMDEISGKILAPDSLKILIGEAVENKIGVAIKKAVADFPTTDSIELITQRAVKNALPVGLGQKWIVIALILSLIAILVMLGVNTLEIGDLKIKTNPASTPK